MTSARLSDILPLSPLAEGLLFHATLNADELDVYAVQVLLDLRGTVDAARLRAAGDAVLARHEMLRAAFRHDRAGRPVQVIVDGITMAWREADLRSSPHQAALDLADEERRSRFDTTRPPLARIALVRLEDDLYQVVLTVHHLLVDGWSIPVLVRDLFMTYLGRGADLPALPSYRQHLELTSRVDRRGSAEVWSHQLSAVADPTIVATAPSAGATMPESIWAPLSNDASTRVEQWARQRGLTPSTVIQGCWAVVLGASLGRRDVVFGTTVSRRRPELEGYDAMVGLFINTVPVVARPDLHTSLADVFLQLRDDQMATEQHNDYGLAEMQQTAGGLPLFDSVLLYENYPLDLHAMTEPFGDFQIERFEGRDATHYPLAVVVLPGKGIRFDHDPVALPAPTVRRLATRLAGVLGRLPEIADAPLPSVTVLTDDERSRILGDGTGPRRPEADRQLWPALLEQAIDEHGARLAVRDAQDELTYAQLGAAACRLARELRARGAGPETIIGIAVSRSTSLVVTAVAVGLTGAAYLPLDLGYPADRLAYMIDDARPMLLVVDDAAAAQSLPADTRAVDLLILDAEETRTALSRHPGTPLTVEEVGSPAAPHGAAYVIYTSGSTGRPKGVVVTHDALTNLLLDMVGRCGLGPADRLLAVTTFAFDIAVLELLGPLLVGAGLVVAEPDDVRDVDRLAALRASSGATIMQATPSLWQLLAAEHPTSLAGLTVLTGGEALPETLAGDLVRHASRVINVYGPTETTVWSTAEEITHSDGPPQIGRPIAGTCTYVLDDALRLAPSGVAGDLYIAGDGLARGYHGRMSLTAERFVADPYGPPGARMYRTGDVCALGEDGRLHYFGRNDNQVKIRGHRIELGEIDTVLLSHPGVLRGVAHVITAPDSAPTIVAYVVGAQQPGPDLVSLRARLRDALPEYMQPSDVVVLDQMPMTENGKIDRPALPRPGGDLTRATRGASATADPLCDLIRQEFAAVLGIEAVPEDLDFFLAGGHSLTAARLISRLRKVLGKEIALQTVFELRTPRAISRALRGAGAAGTGPQRRGASTGPLSAAQWRLWFLDQMGGDRSVYNVGLSVRLDHVVDAQTLHLAAHDLVTRHEILRTVYRTLDPARAGADPVTIVEQVVLPATTATVPVELLGAPVDGDGPDLALLEFARRPFALDHDLPLRIGIRRRADGTDEVVLSMHHIAVDAGSFHPLLHDLFTSYAARRDRRPDELPALELQFLDYSAWEHDQLSTGDDAGVSFWQQTLAGLPDELPMAHDRPRPSIETNRGEVLTLALPADLHRRAVLLGSQTQTTLFMILQATLGATFTALGLGTDVPLGVAVSGRDHEETSDMVGLLVNTVVLRTDLSGDPSFTALLARVRTTDLDAFAHQNVPFDQVVEAVAPHREAGRHPLFQTFIGLSIDDGAGQLPGFSGVQALWTGTAKFDLSFEFVERRDDRSTPAGLDLHLEYATDLFDAASIRVLAERFQQVLEQVTADPAVRITEIDVLLPSERARLETDGTGDVADITVDLLTSIAATATYAPSRTAVVDMTGGGAHEATYAELIQLAEGIARRLEAAGGMAGDLVALLARPGLAAVAAVLGTWLTGAAYVPLSPEAPLGRLTESLAECGARIVMCTPEHRAAAQALAEASDSAIVIVVVTDPSDPGPTRTWSSGPNDARSAYALFTSGSTGRPKAALVYHRGMVNHLLSKVDQLDLTCDDVVVNNAALTFDISVWQMFAALLVGGQVVIPARDVVGDPDALLSLTRSSGVTVLEIVPSLLGAMLDAWDRGVPQPDVVGLRDLMVTGEALPADACYRWHARFPDIPLINAYGPTECSDDVTHASVHGPVAHGSWTAPIGRPIRNTQLYVLDDALRLCPPGTVGELYVAGEGVGLGYVGRPGRTAGAFVANPFGEGDRLYRTGDNVRWLPDGQLEFRERRDHQVKIRGHRIELGDVEAALRALPGVSAAVVNAVRSAGAGAATLVAHVVGVCTVEDMRTAAITTLPAHMVPAAWVLMDALPLSANGKVDRARLPAAEPDTAEGTPRETPKSPTEEFFCAAFADAVGATTVGRSDDFFAVGGDSIRSIRVVAAAHGSGFPISPAQLFVHRTPAALAALVTSGAGTITDDEGVGELPLPPETVALRDRVGMVEGFSQAVVLTVPFSLDVEALRAACSAVVDHHDALRLAVSTQDGWGLQVLPVGAVDGRQALQVVDVADSLSAAAEEAAAHARVALDPRAGTMLQVRLVREQTSRSARLIVAAHHLAVDGASWTVLLPDLAAACVALGAGSRPALPQVGTSYRKWALTSVEKLSEHTDEVAYWVQMVRPGAGQPWGITPSPLDPVQDRGATSTTEWLMLPATTTAQISTAAVRLGVGVETVLVAALALAIEDTREPDDDARGTVLLELESDGRTTVGGTVDVSRTVGWFTSSFPFRVDVTTPATEPVERLREVLTGVARARRDVPAGGTGFGLLSTATHGVDPGFASGAHAQVAFNYLGETITSMPGVPDGWELMGDAVQLATSDLADETPLAHALAVDGVTQPGPDGPTLALRFRWASRLVGPLRGETLVSACEQWLHRCAQQLGSLQPFPTQDHEASLSAQAPDPFSPVLLLQPLGEDNPLFCVHGGVGLAWPYLALAPYIAAGQPLIGLQADSLTEGASRPGSVADIADAHLARIRAMQPKGPYRLLGWSFGGYVAHEIAVRIQAEGDEVEFLAVLDIYPSHGPDDTGDDATLLGRLLQEAGHDTDAPLLAERVVSLDYDGVTAITETSSGLLSAFTAQDLRRLVMTTRTHGALGASFVPGWFGGDMHLVVADLDATSSADPSALWSDHVGGTITTTHVGAVHDDLLAPEHVSTYAPELFAELGDSGRAVVAETVSGDSTT